ncbi:LppX_LprAFG lipoprotein [Pseudonocardia xinjiangensis]|uniref:LppX_LprAFG lipoprotein n=1 Tax=Pseudonocardia xinjiangensis TaxID=75289 RepID=UPI003D8EB524
MSGSKRSGALVGAGVVAIALLAGCSGSGETPAGAPAAQNPAAVAEDPAAAALLAAASEATVAAGTARYELQMHVETGGQQTTVSGTGTYDFDRKIGDLAMTTAGPGTAPGTVDVIIDGATFYTQLPGQGGWTRTQTEGSAVSGQQYDPAQQLATLQKVSDDVRMVGTEQLRGAEVRHVAFAIDPAALASASGMPGDSAAALQSGGPIPGDLWVDQDGRVRKLQMQMTMNQGGTVSTMNVISEYFDFGVPVTVQRPDPATVQGPAGGR